MSGTYIQLLTPITVLARRAAVVHFFWYL